MYITDLHIKNLRCFRDTKFSLRYPGRKDSSNLHAPNINLLLGDNGSGKTTVLKAMALATLGPVLEASSGFRPYYLVRHGETQARIQARAILNKQDLAGTKTRQKNPKLVMTISRRGDTEVLKSGSHYAQLKDSLYLEKSHTFFIVGYGASRRIDESGTFSPTEQSKRRMARYQRVAGLFEPQVPLVPLTAWLPVMKTSNPGRYTQVNHLLNRLLPEGTSFTGEREQKGKGPKPQDSGDYLFEHRGISVPFGALSDGYRAYIGWIVDLLYHVCMTCPSSTKLVDNQGLVLVDEIDLHLHPSWQRIVTSVVSQALRNIQFIFSTHSPIVAGSLEKENIFVMQTDSAGASRVHQSTERIYGLDADQILLSSYFNLETTRAPGYVDELQELSRQAAIGRPDAALAIMRKLSGEPPDRKSQSARTRGKRHKVKSGKRHKVKK
jgi:predicted ATPase